MISFSVYHVLLKIESQVRFQPVFAPLAVVLLICCTCLSVRVAVFVWMCLAVHLFWLTLPTVLKLFHDRKLWSNTISETTAGARDTTTATVFANTTGLAWLESGKYLNNFRRALAFHAGIGSTKADWLRRTPVIIVYRLSAVEGNYCHHGVKHSQKA